SRDWQKPPAAQLRYLRFRLERDCLADPKGSTIIGWRVCLGRGCVPARSDRSRLLSNAETWGDQRWGRGRYDHILKCSARSIQPIRRRRTAPQAPPCRIRANADNRKTSRPPLFERL